MYQQPVVIVKPADSPADRYERLLSKFTSQRVCSSGTNAMQAVETSPARIMVIESGIEDMDAVDLAGMIRDIDQELARFTFIIIVSETLTADMAGAFSESVDAFVSLDDIESLAHVMDAGARLSAQLNTTSERTAELEREREILVAGQLLDPLTGLGNRKMAILTLEDSIAQIESRGGAVCVLMMSIDNRDEVISTYDARIADELTQAIAERLNSLVRPMDTVTYFDDGLFALILVQPSIDHCTAECYDRIFDGVRLKSYRTAVGYLEPRIGMSLCASHAEHGPPHAERMLKSARKGLEGAARTGQIRVIHLSE